MRMREVSRTTYICINDVLQMPSKLNQLAQDFEAEGYEVSRGLGGAVILTLDNGQVHYVPAGDKIQQVIFEHEEADYGMGRRGDEMGRTRKEEEPCNY